MSKLRLKMHLEVEGEDVSEETIRAVEMQAARVCETIEAQIVQAVEQSCPGLKITIGGEDEDWKQ